MPKPQINKIYGQSIDDVNSARLIIGQLVYYSDNKGKMTANAPTELLQAELDMKYPYQCKNVLGRSKYIATTKAPRKYHKKGAVPAKLRMKQARDRKKQIGVTYRSFKVTDGVLAKAKDYCVAHEIPLENLLLELLK